MVKNLAAMWETRVQSLGEEHALEEGMVIHSKCSFLENSMDRGAWRAADHGVKKSRAQLK